MLTIHVAPAPTSAWRDRQDDKPAEHFGGNYFKRADIQGGFGELLIQDIDTHALLVAVPVRRFERDYRFQPEPQVQADESHAILQFRRQA